MKYEKNFRENGKKMKTKYRDSFHNDRLTLNSYHGDDLVEKGEIGEGEKVGVFLGKDKDSMAKAFNVAKSAVEAGADVTLFYRPKWFPEKDGQASDGGNTLRLQIRDGNHLDKLAGNRSSLLRQFEGYDLDELGNLDKSYFTTTSWNRNLQGIREKSGKTVGYLGKIADDNSTEHAYMMERHLIDNVDDFRVSNAKNRQILEERHLDTKNPIKLTTEKKSSLAGKKVLYLPEFSIKNCMVSRWRMEWPTEYLGESGVRYKIKGALEPIIKRGKHAKITGWKDEFQGDGERINQRALDALRNDIDEADVVIFGRTNDTALHKVFDYAKKSGKVIGYEIDDLMFGKDSIDDFLKTDKPGDKPLAHYIGKHLKGADFVTVSTNRLAKEAAKLRGSDNNIYVVRNRLHLNELGDILNRKKKVNKQVRIGWAGGFSHIDKLIKMQDVFRKLYMKHGDKIKFVFKGLDLAKMDEKWKDKYGIFEKGMEGIPFETHGYTPGGNWKQYYKDLADLNLDIFFAPSQEDGPHDAKSELKYLEGALIGAATVAHDYGGHRHAIKNGKNGLSVDIKDLKQGNKQFLESIDKLVEDEGLRRDLQVNAKQDLVKNYDVRRSSEEIHTILEEQLDRKGKLKSSRGKKNE